MKTTEIKRNVNKPLTLKSKTTIWNSQRRYGISSKM